MQQENPRQLLAIHFFMFYDLSPKSYGIIPAPSVDDRLLKPSSNESRMMGSSIL